MISRRMMEVAGFVTIATALHVSAAALLLPDPLQQGAAADGPPAALAAGGEEIRALVSAWNAPTEIRTSAPSPDMPQASPETAPPVPPRAEPRVAAAAPRPLPPPVPVLQPNLPAPPPPAPSRPVVPSDLDLPDLQTFTPPDMAVASPLVLRASARPAPRPERPPEPFRKAAPEPQRPRAQADVQERARPAQRAGQGGQAQAASPGGGGGGTSATARASAMVQWGGQIRGCISRRAAAPRGLRQGGQVVLAVEVGRNGAIRAVGIAGSSGQPALDEAAADAARRAGRCPAAPDVLTQASYPFQLPIQLNVR